MDMNREIKFRAWNGKYMLDSAYGDWISFNGVPYTEADMPTGSRYIEIQKAKDYILMQFTGLLDKEGKDIYEGDLIEMDGTFLYDVRFEDGKFVCYHVKGNWTGKWGDLHRFFDYDFAEYHVKVIGNLYQNHDLLKQTTPKA